MTPAVKYLQKTKIPYTLHTYSLDGDDSNYGQAVADTLNVPHGRLFKTLLVALDSMPTKLAVCIVPVSTTLNLKKAAQALDVKKVAMADAGIAEKATGYVVGGISPFGQKKRLAVVIDKTAQSWETIFTSGGKRGLQIEFAPENLVSSLNASVNDLIN
jgi:Cys-tRNA(Pro)/Cys-tRNA(Cys) deacylase